MDVMTDEAASAVVGAAQDFRAALVQLDFGQLPGTDAAALVEVLATTEKMCAVARARAAARAVACDAHWDLGFSDGADWLARQAGTSYASAKAAIETVAGLEATPATRAAVDAGELSLAQGGEIARAEAAAAGSEAELLDFARTHSLRGLQDRAWSLRMKAADPDDLHRRRHAARSVRHWKDAEGMVHISAALPPEVGLPIVRKLDAETDRIRREERRAGSTEPREAHAADAFVRLLEGSGKGPANRADIVFVCDLRAWRRGHAHPGEPCHVLGGGPLPVSVLRDLAKDAFVKAVIHDGVVLHTVAHLGRHIGAELRTALDLGPLPDFDGVSCTEAGCGQTHGLEWDHIHPNAARGPTSYDNLQPRCWPHHQAKTERDRKAGLIGPAPPLAKPSPRENHVDQ